MLLQIDGVLVVTKGHENHNKAQLSDIGGAIYAVICMQLSTTKQNCPDSKIHGANMGPTWGRQDPGGPHVGHVNLVIWVCEILQI